LKGLVCDESELCLNPEVATDDLRPAGADMLIGNSLVRICGERRPDMYMWVESCLLSYLFMSCGLAGQVGAIRMIHPFHGQSWTFYGFDLVKTKRLYERLWTIWKEKQKSTLAT
jgi:hypothetical protein